jgi:hypothetical protein
MADTYTWGLPTHYRSAGGARAIEELDAGFSLVWDRQSTKGTLPKGFGDKLNAAIPAAQEAFTRLQERQGVGSGYLTAGRHVLVDRPTFHIIADTRGSCGYVYLVAELRPRRYVDGDWAVFVAPNGQTHRVALWAERTDVGAHWAAFEAQYLESDNS